MWKKIPGYEFYEVSEKGEVRSVDREEVYQWNGKECKRFYKGRTLKQTLNKANGYFYVHLGRKAIFPIHQLVAWAFLGPQNQGVLVRHKNGNKKDNSADNLSYGSGLENYEDAVNHGTMTVGERHYNAILTVDIVLDIRSRAAAGARASVIARELGIKYPTVLAVVNRKTWRHV